MHRRLHNLDSSIHSRGYAQVRWQPHLRQTHPQPRVRLVGWPDDLEHGLHDVRVVWRDGAQPDVDVDEGRLVPAEPAGLEGDGAACRGPFRAVGGYGEAAACGEGLSVWNGGGRGRGAGDVHG